MTLKSVVKLSASLCLGLVLSSCSSSAPVSTPTAVTEKRFDHQIADDVRTKIQKDPRMQGTTISVMCDAGSIILSGSVSSREQFGIAQVLAAGTDGARGVINRLQVTPAPDQNSSLPDQTTQGKTVAPKNP
jgi:osmotically-inducible protein OsmY